MNKGKKYYITTPIYYPSGNAHLGHCYSTVAADAVARYKRLQGYDVMFLTGTDEHGQKIEENAKKEGVTPLEYVDKISEEFRNLWELLQISNNKFIRTTYDYHKKAVQKIFSELYEKGEIYKGRYSGWYCTPCESFFKEKQVTDKKCPDCGRELKWQEEEAYFFRLSKYSDKLLDLYEKYPHFIEPQIRKNEMIQFIENGLGDLCVSRTSFSWGIPVEFDKAHVVYVWLDALTNYITALGYESDNDSDYKKYWPANVHFVGKEIVRFHTVIWPAILMALGIPLPLQVYGHGWLIMGDGGKMSKSKGNVIDPIVLCSRYGVDAIRYFLLRDIPFGADGVFTNESLINRINFDLANDLGNLLSRATAMAEKYFGGYIPSERKLGNIDNDLINAAKSLRLEYQKQMDEFKFSSALSKIWLLISKCNKYIDETMPWELGKDEKNNSRLAAIIYNLCECLRIISILIFPVMPNASLEIQRQIGADESLCTWDFADKWGLLADGSKIQKKQALFPRIDAKKELKELEEIFPTSVNDGNHAEEDENINIINMIDIEDFAKVQLRVFRICECEPVKRSKKLLKLTLDDGDKKRTVASGISQYYTPEDLKGRNVILVSNLKPAKLCGVESEGMILAAEDNENDVKVIFVDNISVGSKIR